MASFNFLALAASGYYNDTIFHRNIPGFLLQGGDPSGTGKKGHSIYDEAYFEDEGFGVTHHSQRGTVSMAHKGSHPNTNASQFYIAYAPLPSLDGVNTVFGCLSEGNGCLERIEANAPKDVKEVPATEAIRIISATVLENPFASGELQGVARDH